jgi:glycosyltransferase involved in cell wall biosynthesis
MVALEALASGRPVVCTRTTGTTEILEGSGAGAIVPPNDPAALAEGLRPFLSDAGIAAAAGEKARELVRTECSPDRVAERREECYADVIRARQALG